MSELKWDEGVIWEAVLKNDCNLNLGFVRANRDVIESMIKTWIPILISGDSITVTKVEDQKDWVNELERTQD